jgi:hypothetical protein
MTDSQNTDVGQQKLHWCEKKVGAGELQSQSDEDWVEVGIRVSSAGVIRTSRNERSGGVGEEESE